MSRLLSSLCVVLTLAGCPGPLEDSRDASFETSRMAAAEETAVIELANTASYQLLDEDVGLDARAADGIVSQRPFEDLDALDAVPYVGPAALDRMLTYVRDMGLIEEGAVEVFGIVEGSPLALAILELVNTAAFEVLDDDVRLDVRAVRAIDEARLVAPIPTLTALDELSYMGATAFAALTTYVDAQGLVLDTGDSEAPAPIDCGDVVYEGDVTVNSARDLLALDGVTHLQGSLQIVGTNQLTLRGLESLRCVSGSVSIVGNRYLTDFGNLASLQAVDGTLSIRTSSSLRSVHLPVRRLGGLVLVGSLRRDTSAFSDLEVVDGKVWLVNSSTALPEFESLREIRGDLKIADSSRLTRLPTMPLLTLVMGDLELEDLGAITTTGGGLTALADVRGTLTIEGNDALERVEGFDSLSRLGALTIADNPALRTVHAPSTLTTTRHLTLQNQELTSVRFPGLTSVQYNVHLIDMTLESDPFEALHSIGGNYAIIGGSMQATPSPLVSVDGSLKLDGNGSPLFDSLTTVGHGLHLRSWDGEFPSLVDVGLQLTVRERPSDIGGSLDGFPALTHVGGGVLMWLRHRENISGFPALTHVDGYFRLQMHVDMNSDVADLQDVDGFGSLTHVGTDVVLWDSGLTNVDFLGNLTFLGGNLHITEPNMCVSRMAELEERLVYEHGWTGGPFFIGRERC